MDLTSALALIALTGLLYGTPGPAVLSLAAAGGAFGLRRSLPYLAGIILGLAANLALAGAGLAVVFTRFPALALVFRVASLLYVIWLAKKLLEPSRVSGEERRPLRFRDGLVLNLINPKAYAAALALLSACAETGTSYATTFAWVFVVSTSVGIVVDLAWLSAGALLARRHGSAGMSPGWNLALAGLLVVSVVASTFWI